MNLRQQQPTESGFSLKNIGTLALRKAGDALDAVSNGISSVSSRMRMDASAVLLSVGVIVGANNAVGCGLEVQGECDAECVDAVGKGGASGVSGQGGMNVAGSGGAVDPKLSGLDDKKCDPKGFSTTPPPGAFLLTWVGGAVQHTVVLTSKNSPVSITDLCTTFSDANIPSHADLKKEFLESPFWSQDVNGSIPPQYSVTKTPFCTPSTTYAFKY